MRSSCRIPFWLDATRQKLKDLCERSGVEKYTTDLDSVMSDPHYQVYFDAQVTGRRAAAVKKAIEAGKHIYCEKPTGTSVAEALELYELGRKSGCQTRRRTG